MFAREVDSEEAIKAVLQDVVLHKVDCEKGEGVALAEKFGIRGYPTYYVMNGQGQVISRWVGYGGAEAWAAQVAAAKADRRTLEAKKAAFEAEPTAELARTLAGGAAAVVDLPAAVAYYRQARAMDPDGAMNDTGEILGLMQWGQRDQVFSFEDAETEVKLVMAADEAAPDLKLMAVSLLVAQARAADRAEAAIPYLEAGLAAAEAAGDAAPERAVNGLKIEYALLVEKDADKAVALKKASQREGWQDNPSRLNAFAWWCFENGINLDEALALALRGVELAESDADRANILDTAAEICHALGNCDEAVAHMQRAVELAPDREYFKDQLAKFEQALKEKKG